MNQLSLKLLLLVWYDKKSIGNNYHC